MRRRLAGIVAGIIAGFLLPTGVVAGSQQPDVEARPERSEHSGVVVDERNLGPGVTLVMSPDDSSSSVVSCLMLPAGTGSERPEEVGLAELALNYVLDSSPGLPAAEAGAMLAARGASLSSRIDRDSVSLCTTAPARELPLTLWVAGLRLRTPSPADGSANKTADSLRQDALLRLAESSVLAGSTKLEQLAFQGYRAIENPPVAAASLLEERSLVHLRAFFERNYVASEVVVSVSGSFDPEQAEQLTRRHLGDIGARKRGARGLVEENPPRHTSDRYAMMFHSKASGAELFFGWVGPEVGTREYDALVLANAVVGLGESSRLWDRLVRRNQWAKAVSGWVQHSRGPELFGLRVAMAKRADLDAVAKIVFEELGRLASAGPSAEELDRSRALLDNEFMLALDSPLQRAQLLGETALAFGTASRIERPLTSLKGVTSAEVRSAASRYLGAYQVSTVEVYPSGYPIQPSSTPMKRYYLVQSGDTLIGISKANGVDVDALVSLNGLKRKAPIFPGQKLVIPTGGKTIPKPTIYVVRKGDSLIGIAKKHGLTVRDITSANGIGRNKPIIVGQSLSIPPKKQ